MFRNRLHTVRDIDGGNPPISALGGRKEPREMSQPRWNFGAASPEMKQPQSVHRKRLVPSRKYPAYSNTIER